MRALIVEDDPSTMRHIVGRMQFDGYLCDTASRGEEVTELVRRRNHDVIVLDLGLPGIDGLEVLRRLRMAHISTPVLIVSERNRLHDKILALASGADDYVTKPFQDAELLSRINALVRRSRRPMRPHVDVGALRISSATGTALVDGRPLELTRTEFTVLEYLASHAGEVVARSEIMRHLYRNRKPAHGKIVAVLIHKLRRRLRESLGDQLSIQTVRGEGYRLTAAPSQAWWGAPADGRESHSAGDMAVRRQRQAGSGNTGGPLVA